MKDFKLDVQFVEDAIYECLNSRGNSKKRWKRLDVAYFLSDYLISFGRNRDLNRNDLAHYIHNYIMFLNKIGTYQCASIKGRGQIYGKKAIEKWIRKNPKSCKWVWKGDVKNSIHPYHMIN